MEDDFVLAAELFLAGLRDKIGAELLQLLEARRKGRFVGGDGPRLLHGVLGFRERDESFGK